MRKGQSIGLVGAGKITDSPLDRMWALRERLGPVKASSMRVASRIANGLRAGHAVGDYQEFEDCGLILISIPDSQLPNIVAELSAQLLNWTSKTVVLCSPLLGAKDLEPLAVRGASIGSVCPIPGFEDRWFLLEGDRCVEAQIKQIADSRRTRFTVIRPASKPLYVTALAYTGAMFTPMLVRASDSLQEAGIPVTESQAILQIQVERSVRSHFRAGRKAHWNRLHSETSLDQHPETPLGASAKVRSQHA